MEDNKIYVKGLPWVATTEEVSEYFKECGAINSCNLPISHNGRSSGTAFVVFAERSGLDAALALNGEIWPGSERWLNIKEYVRRDQFYDRGGNDNAGQNMQNNNDGDGHGNGNEPANTIETVFVGNLPWSVSEGQLREFFEDATEQGAVASVRFGTNQDGSFRGFGYVSFCTPEQCDQAVTLNGSDMDGRSLRVNYDKPRDAFDGRGRGGHGRGHRGGGRGDRGNRNY